MQFMYFGHAGEVHDTATATAAHSLVDNPWVAIGVFALCLLLLVAVLHKFFRISLHTTLNIILALLFVVGVFGYRYSAAISGFAIAFGFALAVVLTIGGLRATKHAKR